MSKLTINLLTNVENGNDHSIKLESHKGKVQATVTDGNLKVAISLNHQGLARLKSALNALSSNFELL